MPWLTFMVADIGGAIVWAGFYWLAPYLIGDQLKEFAQPVAILVGCLVLALALGGAILCVDTRFN